MMVFLLLLLFVVACSRYNVKAALVPSSCHNYFVDVLSLSSNTRRNRWGGIVRPRRLAANCLDFTFDPQLNASTDENDLSFISSSSSSSSVEAFDFSSRQGWDNFYNHNRPHSSTRGDSRSRNRIDCSSSFTPPHDTLSFEYEWHSSISHRTIIEEVLSSPESSSCLVIGCGNSALPRVLYDTYNGTLHVTCVDYSLACIEMLRKTKTMGDKVRTNMSFVCADVTDREQMAKLLIVNSKNNNNRNEVCDDVDDDGGTTTPRSNIRKSQQQQQGFGTVIDKGLIDALMCNEGWDTNVEKVLSGTADILIHDGKYILVSYKLSSSTKAFLLETGMKYGLVWSFDLPHKSNDRVSFSIARKSKRVF